MHSVWDAVLSRVPGLGRAPSSSGVLFKADPRIQWVWVGPGGRHSPAPVAAGGTSSARLWSRLLSQHGSRLGQDRFAAGCPVP